MVCRRVLPVLYHISGEVATRFTGGMVRKGKTLRARNRHTNLKRRHPSRGDKSENIEGCMPKARANDEQGLQCRYCTLFTVTHHFTEKLDWLVALVLPGRFRVPPRRVADGFAAPSFRAVTRKYGASSCITHLAPLHHCRRNLGRNDSEVARGRKRHHALQSRLCVLSWLRRFAVALAGSVLI